MVVSRSWREENGSCLVNIDFSFVRWKTYGDWLHNKVNIISNNKLYILKWLWWQILRVFYQNFKKTLCFLPPEQPWIMWQLKLSISFWAVAGSKWVTEGTNNLNPSGFTQKKLTDFATFQCANRVAPLHGAIQGLRLLSSSELTILIIWSLRTPQKVTEYVENVPEGLRPGWSFQYHICQISHWLEFIHMAQI